MKRPSIPLLLASTTILPCLVHAQEQGFRSSTPEAPPFSSSLRPNDDIIHDYRTLQQPRNKPLEAWHAHMNERTLRQDRVPVEVDYMGQHPFEQNTQQQYDNNNNNDTQQRRTQTQRNPATTYNDASRYQPMRVQFDTHLLDALSKKYPAHVSYVRNVLLPSLRTFWSDTLSIIPASRIEVPLRGDDAKCAREVKKLSGLDLNDYLEYDPTSMARRSIVSNIGGDGNVELGPEGDNLIYHNRDLVVIVLPVEGTDLCPEMRPLMEETGEEEEEASSQLQTLAFATNCQHDQLDRPTVGYTGICFGPMDPTDRSTKTHQRRLLTIAHEFTHILGMNSYDFPFFYNHATRAPRTPRDVRNRPPEEEALCVDGSRRQVLKADDATIRAVTTANGYIAYEVVTETVANVVRNQFDCRKMVGGRLENQPTGDTDCFGSHWDHRLFNNEFMTAVYTGSTQYVTALTLALLEDSGWYRPNYAVAQNSPFALGAGCDFLEDRCVQRGKVPSWGEGTFCDSTTSVGCTPDKNLVAYCDIAKWDGNLPSGYQYFEDPSVGGGLQQMDFCPAYTTIFRFEVGEEVRVLDCNDPQLNTAWVHMKGEIFGENSRCIQHASGARPMCLEVICGEYGADAGKVVLVVQGGKRIRCSYAGEVVRMPTGTDVVCPSFEQTCPESICPANCAGRGICDFSQSPAQCQCFNQDDTSEFCADSPYSFAPTISPAPTVSASPTAAPTISPRPTSELDIQSSGPIIGHYCYFWACTVLAALAIWR